VAGVLDGVHKLIGCHVRSPNYSYQNQLRRRYPPASPWGYHLRNQVRSGVLNLAGYAKEFRDLTRAALSSRGGFLSR
jgi:hypothetical protein